MSFLTNRADGLMKRAEAYRKLDGLCRKFGLVPKSGDLHSDESWPVPDQADYWPERHDSVLLTKPDLFPQHVAAVRVCSDGYYYGHVIGVGGNHDLCIGELEGLLQRAGMTPAVVV